MSATLVDTNVLLDIVTADPVWADWSVAALETAIAIGPAWINDVVYAEFSVRFVSIEGALIHLAYPNAGIMMAARRERADSDRGIGRRSP